MQFGQFLLFLKLLLLEFQFFAAQLKQIKKPHLVDEFSCVIGIKENILAKFTSLQILSIILIIFSFLSTIFVFAAIILIPNFFPCTFFFFGWTRIERNGEVYFLIK